MAENTGVHIVEIRAGDSQRPVLELRPGVVVQPMSVGRVGMWSVDAPGVLDVHAYVYFDGRALFVQSADANNPAKGNGQAIGTAWQQLEIPCTIEIGRARLVYRTLEEDDGLADEDKTVAQPLPVLPQRPAPQQQQPQPQFTPNAGTFSNRNRGPDSDATRLQPMAREPDPTVVSPLEAGTPMAGVPKARPAAGMPAWSTNDVAPVSQPTTIGAPPQAPAPPPPQNTGYQAFGSVQVAVPAPPPAPAPTPMGGVPVPRQAMGNPMGQTLQAPMQSPMQPMMQQQGMQPMMQQQPGMMQQGMQPMMMGMQPTMQAYAPGMQPMQQPGMMPYAQGSGPLPQMMGPGQETGRIQPPPEELKGFKKAVAEWKAMPPLRKFIVGTFPGVALLVYFMLFDDKPQPRRVPQPPPSGSVAATASAPSTTPSASVSAPIPTASVPVMPSASASVAVMPSASVAPSASSAPIPVASAKPPPTVPKGKHTTERDAIELVSQGQYTKAAELYEQLAQQHPEQPAYKEAARLLRLKATGN